MGDRMSGDSGLRESGRDENRGVEKCARGHRALPGGAGGTRPAVDHRNETSRDRHLMPVLPRLSGRAVAKAFSRDGWELARQKGSHMILVKEGSWATLSVPDHREVAPGTLR